MKPKLTIESIKKAAKVYRVGGSTAIYAQVRSGKIKPEVADLVIRRHEESIRYRMRSSVGRLFGQISAAWGRFISLSDKARNNSVSR